MLTKRLGLVITISFKALLEIPIQISANSPRQLKVDELNHLSAFHYPDGYEIEWQQFLLKGVDRSPRKTFAVFLSPVLLSRIATAASANRRYWEFSLIL